MGSVHIPWIPFGRAKEMANKLRLLGEQVTEPPYQIVKILHKIDYKNLGSSISTPAQKLNKSASNSRKITISSITSNLLSPSSYLPTKEAGLPNRAAS